MDEGGIFNPLRYDVWFKSYTIGRKFGIASLTKWEVGFFNGKSMIGYFGNFIWDSEEKW